MPPPHEPHHLPAEVIIHSLPWRTCACRPRELLESNALGGITVAGIFQRSLLTWMLVLLGVTHSRCSGLTCRLVGSMPRCCTPWPSSRASPTATASRSRWAHRAWREGVPSRGGADH